MSIDLHQNIKHKILFYKKVQRVVYSWRNSNEESFECGFNKKYDRKKEINIEASSGIERLEVYEKV